MKVIVRGFGNGRLIFEDHMDVEAGTIDTRTMIQQVDRLMVFRRHMLEIEWPDAPEGERFCRFGTDYNSMISPVEFQFGDKKFPIGKPFPSRLKPN